MSPCTDPRTRDQTIEQAGKIIEVVSAEPYCMTMSQKVDALNDAFGKGYLPKAAVEEAMRMAEGMDFRPELVRSLALLRGSEMVEWANQLLTSERLRDRAMGALSLLAFDPNRGLLEIERVVTALRSGEFATIDYDINYIRRELHTHNTPESLALVSRLWPTE